MEQDKKHDIALMRYSVISPLITSTSEDYPSMSAFFRDVSAKGVTTPESSVRKYAPDTIKHWYLNYKQGGFDALLPIVPTPASPESSTMIFKNRSGT